jgi:hypothetical protein
MRTAFEIRPAMDCDHSVNAIVEVEDEPRRWPKGESD